MHTIQWVAAERGRQASSEHSRVALDEQLPYRLSMSLITRRLYAGLPSWSRSYVEIEHVRNSWLRVLRPK
jgi:hypothetical protein